MPHELGTAEEAPTVRRPPLRDAMPDLRHSADQNDVDFHQAMDSPYEACLEERRLG